MRWPAVGTDLGVVDLDDDPPPPGPWLADLTGSQLLFRFVAAAYERRSLGIASHWPFEAWGRFLPEHTTATSIRRRRRRRLYEALRGRFRRSPDVGTFGPCA